MKSFPVTAVISAYFCKDMTEDGAPDFEVEEYLLNLSRKKFKSISGTKMKKLLESQVPWLADIKLSYYDDPKSAKAFLHKLTSSEKKKKKVWLNKTLKKYGNEVKLRRFTDIEKAFLGY